MARLRVPSLDDLHFKFTPSTHSHDPTRNPVGWFEIYVTDMARAKAFYETVFATTCSRWPTHPDGMPGSRC